MFRRDSIPFLAGLSVVWLTTLALALWSIDYGYHWDEHLLTDALQQQAGEGRYLPGWYNYPSFTYDLTAAAMAPELIVSVVHHRRVRDHTDGMAGYWAEHFPTDLIVRSRRLSAGMTLLPVLGVGLLAWFITRDRWAGFLGTLIMAGSFEYFYHARWLAPDGLMACLAFMTTGLVALYWQHRRWSLLMAAALVAGLTCGTKYPGGIFLVPVLLASMLSRETRSGWGLVLSWSQIVGLFLLAFVLSTPGSLLEPYKFLGDITRELSHYKNGHGAYTVSMPLEHSARMARYLLIVAPSRLPALSFILLLPALWGAVCLGRRDWRLLVLILGAPALYALYFSTQKAMLVRNYLVLIPFLGLLAAWGFHDFRIRFHHVRVQWGLRAVFILIGVANLSILGYTSWTVNQRSMADPVAEIRLYLEDHPDLRYSASDMVLEALGAIPANVARDLSSPVQGHLAFLREPSVKQVVNRSGYVIHATGPCEVNLDYYSSWAGDDRIVVLNPAHSPKKFR